jgi:D-xylose 1-dehydrogenase (NADP+, D-xylono-1,5-lactone-forming)
MILNSPGRIKKIRSAMPRKLKWGVAGCGSFAENVFLPSLQSMKLGKLVSVFSHDLNRAKQISQKFGAPDAFDNYDEFLKSNIDAVYISGNTSDHFLQVTKAAEAGKNILCEKPLALNSRQIEEMIDVCKKNNVILIINHQHRFHPLIIKVKELLDKQMLGKIVSISASYHINMTPDNNFRFNKQLSGGGALRDIGSQMIDMLRYFGGEISEVKAFMDNVVYKSEVEDYASANLKFEKGGYGYFCVSYDSQKPFMKVDIVGHNGSISVDGFYDKNIITKLTIDLHGEGKKVFRKRINKIVFLIKSVQRSFLKKQPPLVTGEDGLKNMRIIEEIEKQCLAAK